MEGEEKLQIVNTIGFNGNHFVIDYRNIYFTLDFILGKVPNGLLVHPDGGHIVYPLGCTIIAQEIKSKKQSFLSGHSNNISCLACSQSGKYLASGQVNEN